MAKHRVLDDTPGVPATTTDRVRLSVAEARALTNLIACYAVLAYNMNTYELDAPAHPTERALTP